MLTLGKFLTAIGIIFAVVFAILFSLATFVEPRTRDMGFTVRAEKYIRQP